MFINKNKKRALSLTGNIITATITFTVLAKNIFPRIKISDIFSEDRKKFKAYETKYRIYF